MNVDFNKDILYYHNELFCIFSVSEKKAQIWKKCTEYFVFLNVLLKIEAELVLKMFLIFAQKWGSCSYELCSYKKNMYKMIERVEIWKIITNW